MKIHVHDERGTKLFDLDDDCRTLSSYNVQSKMILQVEETNLKRTHMFDDTGDVPKFELTDEEYKSRKNTARQFLQDHKIGKYNPTAQEEHARKEKEKEEQEQQLATKMNVDDRFVHRSMKKILTFSLSFIDLDVKLLLFLSQQNEEQLCIKVKFILNRVFGSEFVTTNR